MNVIIDEKPSETKIHGKTLVDNFHWMKTNKSKAVDVIKGLNKHTDNFLDKLSPIQKKVASEIKSRILEDYTTLPTKTSNYEYQYKIKEGENYGRYYAENVISKYTIMDCEKLAKPHKYWDMTGPNFSPNEEFLLFSVDSVGNDENKLYYKRYIDDDIIEIKQPNGLRMTVDFMWDSDSRGIYYVTMNKSNRSNKIWYTTIDEPTKHVCVFTETDELYSVSPILTTDKTRVLIYSSSHDYTEVHLVKKKTETKLLFSKKEKSLISVDRKMNRWFVLFEKEFKSKILYADDLECQNLKTWVAYRKDYSIEYFVLRGDYMLVGMKYDGLPKLYLMKLANSDNMDEIKFDSDNYSLSIPDMENLNLHSNKILFFYDNWVVKGKKIELDLETKKQKILKEYKVPSFNEKDYVQTRITVKDKLRMTVLYNKSKINFGKETRPCFFDGYGAYGATIEPGFDSKIPSLLDRGFIYCITHIRGGGYYNTKWYKEGKLLKKKNTFNDFADCVSYMIDKKYTVPEKVSIFGRSAGGLLIGAVANMIPEKINLAVMGVPFVDCINTMLDETLALTTGEYSEWGNPKEKKYFDYMLQYSPYENICLSKKYPHMYIYGNLEDSRVAYWEPLKYYAQIRKSHVYQMRTKGIHLHINTEFGHSQSSERYAEIIEFAKIYSVIIHYNSENNEKINKLLGDNKC